MATLRGKLALQAERTRVFEQYGSDAQVGEFEQLTRGEVLAKLDVLEHYWEAFNTTHAALLDLPDEDSRLDEYFGSQRMAWCLDVYTVARAALLARREDLADASRREASDASRSVAGGSTRRRKRSSSRECAISGSVSRRRWRSPSPISQWQKTRSRRTTPNSRADRRTGRSRSPLTSRNVVDAKMREVREVHPASSTEVPAVADLRSFLTGCARAFESLQRTPTDGSTSRSSSATSRRASSGHVRLAQASGSQTYSCSMCGGAHFLASCTAFRTLSGDHRRQLVVEQHLCFNCLGKHSAAACRSEKRCQECGNKHHTLIHQADRPPPTMQTSASSSPAQSALSRLEPSAAPTHSNTFADSRHRSRRCTLRYHAVGARHGCSSLIRSMSPRGRSSSP